MKDRGSIVAKLHKNNFLQDVKPYALETHYEVIMGSFAYGVSSDTSDMDIYGIYIPPLDHIFPHIAGHIPNFGEPPQKDTVFQSHGISLNEKEYDINLYSIVRYFELCRENNPNMIDSLFVPDRCIVHQSEIGKILRENRKLFLHKGIHHKLKGYAYQQLKKIRTKESHGKRKELVDTYGFDVKFAYHVARLLMQSEMIMMEHDLDLEKNRELLKSIRRGEWTLEELEEWFKKREGELDTLYISSDLRHGPDNDLIKRVLMNCLEAHFGSLSAYFNMDGSDKIMSDKLNRIRKILDE